MARPEIEDAIGDWQVWLDLSVTRRKISHTIIDPSGEVLYHSRFLSECLAYLDRLHVRRYVLVPNRERSLALPLSSILIEKD